MGAAVLLNRQGVVDVSHELDRMVDTMGFWHIAFRFQLDRDGVDEGLDGLLSSGGDRGYLAVYWDTRWAWCYPLP